METNEIFENLIKIEPKVVSIETLFNNEETLKNTKYDPDYQRNYVWDNEKATYFIESILLGTEIPPIIYFRNGEKIEAIDGRQRYQTILRFIKDEFKLKSSGLYVLDRTGITGKSFKGLGDKRDFFWDTKLRIIEFSFISKSFHNEEKEDIVKREVFKRYNSGITPLKLHEIDKAFYLYNGLNRFMHQKLLEDKVLLGDIMSLLHFEKNNIELLLKKIRQLLVQHNIPIKYYTSKKHSIIAEYYEHLSDKMSQDDMNQLFSTFVEKINFLKTLHKVFIKKNYPYNRLVSECIFWGLSILEEKNVGYRHLGLEFIHELADYINKNKNDFMINRSSFFREIHNRYNITAHFFEKKFNIQFTDYIVTSNQFKANNRTLRMKVGNEKTSFDELRLNKPEPSSITIVDICRQMEKQRFLIRPRYQRMEVINKNKSSAIIESILLGIKLPPIFVYKREDGITEVLDGQQRLLSILGFLKKEYLDENNEKQTSLKHGYSLNLKNGILKHLDGLTVDKLEPELVKKINNFDLWIIEINHRYNNDFEPIDLFLRLNRKPYPIKENTFEMWNSYIDKSLIEHIKSLAKDHKEWLYFRKNNSRMDNENIYASLVYLQYEHNYVTDKKIQPLECYQIGNKIVFRIRSKSEITKLLEYPSARENILNVCQVLRNDFIQKVKRIVSANQDTTFENMSKNLDNIFHLSPVGRRSQHNFYALWYFLSRIKSECIPANSRSVREELRGLFNLMNSVESKEIFDKHITDFWKKYS